MPVWVQIPPSAPIRRTSYLNQGDVAKWTKAEVCKTSIRRFESARRLQPQSSSLNSSDFVKFPTFTSGWPKTLRSGCQAPLDGGAVPTASHQIRYISSRSADIAIIDHYAVCHTLNLVGNSPVVKRYIIGPHDGD